MIQKNIIVKPLSPHLKVNKDLQTNRRSYQVQKLARYELLGHKVTISGNHVRYVYLVEAMCDMSI